MKTLFAVFLLAIQLGWAQQPPTSPLVFGQDTLDLGQKPIMLSEVVVGTQHALGRRTGNGRQRGHVSDSTAAHD